MAYAENARASGRHARSVPPGRLFALGALTRDRADRRGGAADRLGARLPRLAEVLRQGAAPARHPRGDRVRQPRPVGPRRDRDDRGGGARVHAAARSGATSRCSACLLPLGVVAQAVLGGFTVREHLAPGFVMAHFALSMLILIAAVALAWRARHEPGARPRSTDRLTSGGSARSPRSAGRDLRRHGRDRRRSPRRRLGRQTIQRLTSRAAARSTGRSTATRRRGVFGVAVGRRLAAAPPRGATRRCAGA